MTCHPPFPLRILLRNNTPNSIKSDDANYKGLPIECRECGDAGPEGNARAFCQRDPWSITLCANRLLNLDDIRESLRHELVHVFDFSRGRYDFNSCRGLAASEVRAAREAECSGRFMLSFMRERCIKSHAQRSTANIFPQIAGQCVRDEYEAAMKDLAPMTEEQISK